MLCTALRAEVAAVVAVSSLLPRVARTKAMMALQVGLSLESCGVEVRDSFRAACVVQSGQVPLGDGGVHPGLDGHDPGRVAEALVGRDRSFAQAPECFGSHVKDGQ